MTPRLEVERFGPGLQPAARDGNVAPVIPGVHDLPLFSEHASVQLARARKVILVWKGEPVVWDLSYHLLRALLPRALPGPPGPEAGLFQILWPSESPACRPAVWLSVT